MSDAPWLVVIDMQRIFAEAPSPWASPRYAQASAGVRALLPHFGDRVVYTRYVAPAPDELDGAWKPYFELWPFALVPPTDPLYELMPELPWAGHEVVTKESFGKWSPELDQAVGGSRELVLAGVSTDCCVIATALPASDAGRHVRVVADACAGLSPVDHQRALDAMALFAPLIEITTVADVLAS
ncbi:cysteine hydrolase [Gryllotalpicola sp.]|uniref:cysteine hydrolase family protein n=1 Tax=Gryllotalpicola sp. TaxID=1932787 RepID=UPI002637CA23|nr:cysteine hydrolase [Gryllotalpicola sp.]